MTGSEPVELQFKSSIPPELYGLSTQGLLGVRWNGTILTASPSPSAPATILFTVPPELRKPGLVEFVLWDKKTQQPLPQRGWMAVVIPISAELCEVDGDADRLVAAITGDDPRIEVYRLSTGVLRHAVRMSPGHRVLAFTRDTLFAWVVEGEEERSVARLDLSTGQSDQRFQIPDLFPLTLKTQAWVYPRDPSMVLVAGRGSFVHALANGIEVPNGRLGLGSVTGFDDQGRPIFGRTVCDLDATTGFSGCTHLLEKFANLVAAWRNRAMRQDYMVLELPSGKELGQLEGSSYYPAAYVPSAGRFVSSRGPGIAITDAESLERLTTLEGVGSLRRAWAPDWVLLRSNYGLSDFGLAAARIPQLHPAPAFTAEGLANAAAPVSGSVAAGEIVSIYGANLGPAGGAGAVVEPGLHLATEVEGTEVLCEGFHTPILYTGPGQINTVIPETVLPGDTVTLQVRRYGIPSARITVPVTAFSPALFGYQAAGKTYAAAQDAKGRVQGPGSPLRRGEVAVFWGTGVGLPSGAAVTSVASRAAQVPMRPSILIGGRPAEILYAGVSPGMTVGLTQINVRVPPDAPQGDAVEVKIAAGSTAGAANVWVAIE